MVAIYYIHNKISNKFYIGQSTNFKSRIRKHKNDLIINKHRNSHIQKSFNLHGLNNFEFIKLIECNVEELDELEVYLIDMCKKLDICYNFESGGHLNKKHSEETKQKMSVSISKARKGKFKGKDNPFYGKKHTKEIQDNINKKLKNKFHSIKNSFYDKKHSEETKQKMRLAWSKRKPVSEETKQKMRLAKVKFSEEDIINIYTLYIQGATSYDLSILYSTSKNRILRTVRSM